MKQVSTTDRTKDGRPLANRPWSWVEVALIFALFFVYAGGTPPDVNEAHYLAKAKHYWDPAWCATDLFLRSADAHTMFYWTIGWLTRWFPLPAVAWIGRCVTWLLLACGWQRLSASVIPRRLVSLLTAALFLLVLDRFHLAGEWVVGGVEAKGIAYALVFLGLSALVNERWKLVWLWLGAASAVHVLVGGWSVVAAVIAWCLSGSRRPPLRSQLAALTVGFLLSLTGLAPAAMLDWGVDGAMVHQANTIYVFERLGHHLSVRRMAPARIALFAVSLATWAVLWSSARRHRAWSNLNRFTVGAVAIAAVGAGIDVFLAGNPALSAGLLRFYWFRCADTAVPLSIVTAAVLGIQAWESRHPQRARSAWCGAIILAMLFVSSSCYRRYLDFRPGAVAQSYPLRRHNHRRAQRRYRQWLEVCRWIRENTRPDDRFLTPRGQQTFKWYAQRAEVVAWKDIPQDAESVVQWRALLDEIYPARVIEQGLGAWPDRHLTEIAAKYQVDYILIDRGRSRRRLGFLRVYPNPSLGRASFELYQIGTETPDGVTSE